MDQENKACCGSEGKCTWSYRRWLLQNHVPFVADLATQCSSSSHFPECIDMSLVHQPWTVCHCVDRFDWQANTQSENVHYLCMESLQVHSPRSLPCISGPFMCCIPAAFPLCDVPVSPLTAGTPCASCAGPHESHLSWRSLGMTRASSAFCFIACTSSTQHSLYLQDFARFCAESNTSAIGFQVCNSKLPWPAEFSQHMLTIKCAMQCQQTIGS